MEELISKRQAVSRISDLLMFDLQGKRLPTWDEVNDAIQQLPPAEHSTNLAEVGMDCISRQAAIDALRRKA